MAEIETVSSSKRLAPVKIEDGVIGGVVAGLVYSAYALTINVMQNGVETFFFPLRQIGAVALGREALDPSYNLFAAVAAGLAVHVALSAVYGLVFAALARSRDIQSGSALVVWGALYGLAIYLLNLFVVFPAAFPWFLENDPLVQSFGHAVMFGAAIGVWLSMRHLR